MRSNPRSSSIVGSVLMPGILALACASGTALAHNHTGHEQTASANGAAPETDAARNFEEPSETMPREAPAMDEPPVSPAEADAPEMPPVQDGGADMDEPTLDEAPEAAPSVDAPEVDPAGAPAVDEPHDAMPEDAPAMDAEPDVTEPDMTAPDTTDEPMDAPAEEPTEPAQPEPTAEEPEMAPEPGPRGQVSRGQFTSGIDNREPVDNLTRVDADTEQVYFFSEIMDHEGGEIIHRWRYRDDQEMGDIHFDVGGPRWRIWSIKTLDPAWTGPWHVEVVTQDGEVLDTYRFELR
ncbi:DUF2914 domain-containing protein [Ectothiorhodospira haloalkaliphila]|uniref:DUF2914 domain-containing protein n=1 Tax=Ectothiorhodospira haloalkaliphila TaxID=421628 RepID=UPI000A026855|nr:DUF2914 domain-containing protein [Ectothiorhodospira haloalkaliphila]